MTAFVFLSRQQNQSSISRKPCPLCCCFSPITLGPHILVAGRSTISSEFGSFMFQAICLTSQMMLHIPCTPVVGARVHLSGTSQPEASKWQSLRTLFGDDQMADLRGKLMIPNERSFAGDRLQKCKEVLRHQGAVGKPSFREQSLRDCKVFQTGKTTNEASKTATIL